MKYCLPFLFTLLVYNSGAQDTFSIVAVDPATGEVGSAGASCVDLLEYEIEDAGFLGVLIPGLGAINTQSYYDSTNQANATECIRSGMTPQETIQWLEANDVDTLPGLRQYGIAVLQFNSAGTAAYTGSGNMDFKGHINGPTYSIQGNILSSRAVLDSMEVRFNRTNGSLSDKLMAALEGAHMIGADSRCAENGTSSLFAFIKVAQPDDSENEPSLALQVVTAHGDGIEPISELRKIYNNHQKNEP